MRVGVGDVELRQCVVFSSLKPVKSVIKLQYLATTTLGV